MFKSPKIFLSLLVSIQCRITTRFYSSKKKVKTDVKNLLDIIAKMPKQVTHTIALKNHRKKLKEKGSKYAPGTVNLQVLGSGADGAPRALYIFTDQSRYLFNCGEGSQRLAHEHKMKLSKLEHIFITQPSWENIGGLLGLSLTIQDVGVPQITIHGPPGTDGIFSATRRFVVLRNLSIESADCARGSVFEDSVLKVQYVPLYTPTARDWLAKLPQDRSPPRSPERVLGSDDSTDDDVDYYSYWHSLKSRSPSPSSDSGSCNKRRRHLSPENGSNHAERPPPGSVSLAYVCRLAARPGQLDLQACVSRGVPPGPLLGRLKAGHDVTLPDGTTVLSKDVTSPDEPGPVFIVVECPSEQFLDSLVVEELFKPHQADPEGVGDPAYLVVHFSPPHIMQHQRYQEWMARFSPSTHHLVLNSSNQCMGSVAVHRIQHKLHMLSEDLFPLLADKGIPSADDPNRNSDVSRSKCHVEENGISEMRKKFSIIQGSTFHNIYLRPQRDIDFSPRLLLEPQQYRQETLTDSGFSEALATLQAELTSGQDRPFPRVTFLGTGSCIPNKTRNTSGILLHISAEQFMLVDCGEATYGQLVRLYGRASVQAKLRRLRAVYISHLHADHHIGLVGILKARLSVCQDSETLYLLAPKQIRSWLTTYHNNFEPILTGVELVPNSDLLHSERSLAEPRYSALLSALGLSAVQTCPVEHCPNAFGLAVSHPSGWKITYSGDTMPCDQLVQLGKDSDLLIHEATMEDDLAAEARLKLHSTTSQAIEVGRQMNARFTLLTHFSQRYAKVPIFNDSFTSNVGIAFDNMEVCLSELCRLPLLYPALRLMFAEHYEEMELKAFKRQLQQQRQAAQAAS